ncbi:MAG: trigger factor, partial [Candidatus Gracilibacteria bacterium]
MPYTLKRLPHSEVELTVTVEGPLLQKCLKRATEELSHDVKVKGFRPGHVPPHVLEQYIDKKYILAHAQDLAIREAYVEAAMKEKLDVVSKPKIKIGEGEPLNFTATVAVMPEVEIKDHASIKVPHHEAKVTEKDVEDVISQLKKTSTTYKEVDRAAKKGDRVEVDFEGFDGEKAVESTKSQNHPVILGSDSLIPGFEDHLAGLKKGEKHEFDITFPKDYHKKDFQNKKLKFKVELKMVEEAAEPVLDEAFVEKVTGKKQSVAELKKLIEKDIHARKTEEAKTKRESEYIEALLKKTKIDLPQSMVEEELDYMIDEAKHDLEHRGVNFEQYLEKAKTTLADLRKKYLPEAEKRISIRLSLQKLIKEEGIKVTDADLKAEIAKIKSF